MAIFRYAVIVLCLAGVSESLSAAEVVKIEPRAGVYLKMLVDAPAEAKALAMLFPGGAGTVKIKNDGAIKGMKGNFLTRTRQLFIANGVATALVDAPSDHQDKPGLTFAYRMSEEHAADIMQAIGKLREAHPGLSIWLVGTSRGSTSAANAAANITSGGADGVVLTSSVGVASRHGGNVLDFKLEAVTIPALVVHHADDGCAVTPIAGGRDIKARLTGAKASELLEVAGGEQGSGEGSGRGCGAQSHHGFLGIERRVVEAISAWIKSH